MRKQSEYAQSSVKLNVQVEVDVPAGKGKESGEKTLRIDKWTEEVRDRNSRMIIRTNHKQAR